MDDTPADATPSDISPLDAFDQMAAFAAPADTDRGVSAAFVRSLRQRVERALDPTDAPRRLRFDLAGTPRAELEPTKHSSDSTSPTEQHPERSSTMPQVITPYLAVHDANAAIEWYREYFGASVSNIIPWQGRVGHSELDISGAVFYMSDEAHELGVYAPERDGSRSAVSIVLQVAAVEEFVDRAVRGGAVLQRPIEESHGSRNGWLVDPFGHRWNVATPVYDDQQTAARVGPSEPYYMTISTADVEKAAAFYGSVLRWETSAPNPAGGRHVENTEMPIGIRPLEMQFGTTEPGQIEMWFTVRDFDAAVERVRVAGGTVVALNNWDSGREAVCEDDQGVTFKLSEPAPGYEK